MPSKKSTSPEAAQNKLRKAEIRELEKARKNVLKSVDAEINQAARVVTSAAKIEAKAMRDLHAANKKYDRLVAKLETSQKRDLAQIERRIAILGGRVGSN
jgi:uncharacterized protein YlxW (UPF0749 family)